MKSLLPRFTGAAGESAAETHGGSSNDLRSTGEAVCRIGAIRTARRVPANFEKFGKDRKGCLGCG
jgi:hypothetical protein